jgi:hypothetical protein
MIPFFTLVNGSNGTSGLVATKNKLVTSYKGNEKNHFVASRVRHDSIPHGGDHHRCYGPHHY